MLEKRLISALLDQLAVLTAATKALSDEAQQHCQGYRIEEELQLATLSMIQACSSLSEVKGLMEK